MEIKEIVILGAGKVASALGNVLIQNGYTIIQIYNRTLENAIPLAEKWNCVATDRISEVAQNADLYLISVKDDAIASLANALSSLSQIQPLVVHTSGALAGKIINQASNRFGVFYPLQTFTSGRDVNFQNIPICVEASNYQDVSALSKVARSISQNVYHLSDEQRAQMHVAAVFANNFTNHLFHIAQKILDQKEIPFQILFPLIEETVKKIASQSPITAQTGPAIRHDQQTINKHLSILAETPTYLEIYEKLTISIQNSSIHQL